MMINQQMSLNSTLLLYGGGRSAMDQNASTYRDFYCADRARQKFCESREYEGKAVPATTVTKTADGYIWHLA